MGHYGYIPASSGFVFCKDCEMTEQQAKLSHQQVWCPRHSPSESAVHDSQSNTQLFPNLTFLGQASTSGDSMSNSDYPPLPDAIHPDFHTANSQAVPGKAAGSSQPSVPGRRPGAGRKAANLRINIPNPPPIGSEPDPQSHHVTAFPDGSLRGQPSAIWAYLKQVGLCANKNCRQQLDDPYYASCAKCRAADNVKAKRYQAKKKAARAAAEAAATASSSSTTSAAINSQRQKQQQRLQTPQQPQFQHDYVLGHSRVEKPFAHVFILPPWIRDELSRLESQHLEQQPDDDSDPLTAKEDRHTAIREELYQIILGRAETSIAQIRAQPQNAVSQEVIEAMIQEINLGTLDDLTAVRLATDCAGFCLAPFGLQEEVVHEHETEIESESRFESNPGQEFHESHEAFNNLFSFEHEYYTPQEAAFDPTQSWDSETGTGTEVRYEEGGLFVTPPPSAAAAAAAGEREEVIDWNHEWEKLELFHQSTPPLAAGLNSIASFPSLNFSTH
ncbi:hypothetical protein QBC43DRAFT_292677 [Cladorrhinum sp. PSN259]|nr:hypothetical protein QBC43DRAFT_292677 [Cladorrhinum sp. PSN259]